MAIARYYAVHNQDPLNPRIIYGVPLADIEDETWEALPAHLRESADASGLYHKTKPPAAKVKQAEKQAAKVEAEQQAAEEDNDG